MKEELVPSVVMGPLLHLQQQEGTIEQDKRTTVVNLSNEHFHFAML